VKYILKTFNIGDKMKHKLTQSAIEEINKKKGAERGGRGMNDIILGDCL